MCTTASLEWPDRSVQTVFVGLSLFLLGFLFDPISGKPPNLGRFRPDPSGLTLTKSKPASNREYVFGSPRWIFEQEKRLRQEVLQMWDKKQPQEATLLRL